MVVPASDVDALFELLRNSINELRGKEPEHELLKFAGPVLQTEHWTEEIGEEFLSRYDKNGRETVITVRVVYLIDLDTVLGKRPVKTATSEPQPPILQPPQPDHNQQGFSGYDAGEIPF